MVTVNSSSFMDHDARVWSTIKFWLYLVFLIPSIFCSLFVLYFLLSSPSLRQALHNHAIIVFLCIGLCYQVTVYPWMLYYHYYEGIWHRSPFFCTIWSFIDWGLYFTQTILFAWATIERHIFIFHHIWISTKKTRFLIHYLPLTTLILYCLIYYVIIIFFPSCKNFFDSSHMVCIGLCSFLQSSTLYIYDTVVHQILPNVVIVVFSLALLLRVHRHKQRVGKSLEWRKHWKMTSQVLFVSTIYLLFALPITIMNLLHLIGLPRTLTYDLMEYLLVFNYCMLLLCPFACAASLPQLQNKVKTVMRLQRQTRLVTPATWHVRNAVQKQTFTS